MASRPPPSRPARPPPSRPPQAARPAPRRPNAPAPRPAPATGMFGGQATQQQLEQYFKTSVDDYAASNVAYLKDFAAYKTAYQTDPENEAVLIPIIMRLRDGAQTIDQLRTENAQFLPRQFRTPNFADDIDKFKKVVQMWSQTLQQEIQEAREEGQTVAADGTVTGGAGTAPGQDTGLGKPPGRGGMPTHGRGDVPGRGGMPTRGRGAVPVRGRGAAPGRGGAAGRGRGTIPGQGAATGYPPKPLPATVPGQGTGTLPEMTEEEEMNMANSWGRTVTVDPTAATGTTEQADSQFAPPPTGDDSVAASSNGAGGRFGDPVPGQTQAKGGAPPPQRPGVDRARPAPAQAPTQGRYPPPTGDDSVPASSNGAGGRYPPPTGDDSVPASSG